MTEIVSLQCRCIGDIRKHVHLVRSSLCSGWLCRWFYWC